MSHPPIGIDLGTTFSALAVINTAGSAEIVANADGNRLTASAVYFEGGPTDKPVVGANALAAAGGFPDRVVRSMKRHMGDPDWRFAVDDAEYSAVDISSLILKKVVQDAAQTLGPLQHAVITVPAYFGQVRRDATKQAAEQAGINVLELINEPTSAALAYAQAGQAQGKVLVYDFGGGTFDVSLVEINSETDVRVIASEGDPALGGDDLDDALAGHFDDLFAAEHSVSLLGSGDEAVRHHLKTASEQAKKTLSTLTQVAGIPLNWANNFLSVSITRDEFEGLIRNKITQTEMLVELVLSEAGVKPEELDDILLVGGSTRIPAVTQMLEKKLARKPRASINADEAVALGAAIQAGRIMQEQGLYDAPGMADVVLQDVTNFSYGTIVISAESGELINSIIIPKNTPIPHEATESFYTVYKDQPGIDCTVTQGEGKDPEFIEVMEKQELSLPPGRPAGCEVTVTFAYDASQIMSAKFLDVESDRQADMNIRLKGSKDTSGRDSDVDLQDDDGLDDLLI